MTNEEGHNSQTESKGNHTIIDYNLCVVTNDVNAPLDLGSQAALQADLALRSQAQ